MSVLAKLDELGIKLPAATAPVAAFAPFVRSGDLVFVSGHIAKRDDRERCHAPLLVRGEGLIERLPCVGELL